MIIERTGREKFESESESESIQSVDWTTGQMSGCRLGLLLRPLGGPGSSRESPERVGENRVPHRGYAL